MKKTLFYLSILAFAALGFNSCDEEEGLQPNEPEKTQSNDPEKTQSNDPDTVQTPVILPWIVGTWVGDTTDYHYPVVTFNSDSTYEWEYGGIHKMKDEGTYTFDSSRIVMKIKTIYEYEDDKYKPTSEYRKSDRVCKILDLREGLLKVELNDYFMGGGSGGFDFILYKKDFEQNITEKDLLGTWESYDEDGNIDERIVVSEQSFTSYSVWFDEDDSVLCVKKVVGSWSVSKNVLKVTPTNGYYSYSTGVDINNMTVYTYYDVDPETLEAEQWAETRYTPDEYTERIYLDDDKLYAGGYVFIKKK